MSGDDLHHDGKDTQPENLSRPHPAQRTIALRLLLRPLGKGKELLALFEARRRSGQRNETGRRRLQGAEGYRGATHGSVAA